MKYQSDRLIPFDQYEPLAAPISITGFTILCHKNAANIEMVIGYHSEVERPTLLHDVTAFYRCAERINEAMIQCRERGRPFYVMRVNRDHEFVATSG